MLLLMVSFCSATDYATIGIIESRISAEKTELIYDGYLNNYQIYGDAAMDVTGFPYEIIDDNKLFDKTQVELKTLLSRYEILIIDQVVIAPNDNLYGALLDYVHNGGHLVLAGDALWLKSDLSYSNPQHKYHLNQKLQDMACVVSDASSRMSMSWFKTKDGVEYYMHPSAGNARDLYVLGSDVEIWAYGYETLKKLNDTNILITHTSYGEGSITFIAGGLLSSTIRKYENIEGKLGGGNIYLMRYVLNGIIKRYDLPIVSKWHWKNAEDAVAVLRHDIDAFRYESASQWNNCHDVQKVEEDNAVRGTYYVLISNYNHNNGMALIPREIEWFKSLNKKGHEVSIHTAGNSADLYSGGKPYTGIHLTGSNFNSTIYKQEIKRAKEDLESELQIICNTEAVHSGNLPTTVNTNWKLLLLADEYAGLKATTTRDVFGGTVYPIKPYFNPEINTSKMNATNGYRTPIWYLGHYSTYDVAIVPEEILDVRGINGMFLVLIHQNPNSTQDFISTAKQYGYSFHTAEEIVKFTASRDKVGIHSRWSNDALYINVSNDGKNNIVGLTLDIGRTVRSARIGNLYTIFVKNDKVVLPELKSMENLTLQIQNGKEYDPHLPHLISISNPTVDVLRAIYDGVDVLITLKGKGCVELVVTLPKTGDTCPYNAINAQSYVEIGDYCKHTLTTYLTGDKENITLSINANPQEIFLELPVKVVEGELSIKIEYENSTPLPNATIFLDGDIYETDRNGKIKLNLKEGHYDLLIKKQGFAPKVYELFVGKKIPVDISLKTPLSLTRGDEIIITITSNGTPVSHANVSYAGRTKHTTYNGKVTFTAVTGKRKIQVHKYGYESSSIEVTVETKPHEVDMLTKIFVVISIIIILAFIYSQHRQHKIPK